MRILLLVFVLLGLGSSVVQESWAASAKKGNIRVKRKAVAIDPIKHNQFKRFQKGYKDFGINLGYGFTDNIPPGSDRTDWNFVSIFPYFKYNLTGPIGRSFYKGSLSWFVDAGAAISHSPEVGYVLGFTPIQGEYKFLWSNVDWAPYINLGAGFAYTDWTKRGRELGSDFEFLLNGGAGIEFYKTREGAFNLNYKFWHISNAGIKRPNIGLNTHVFSIGYSF